jgi:hypothetical protein
LPAAWLPQGALFSPFPVASLITIEENIDGMMFQGLLILGQLFTHALIGTAEPGENFRGQGIVLECFRCSIIIACLQDSVHTFTLRATTRRR